MATTAKGLTDEKASRMMEALRRGETLRQFSVKRTVLEAYFDANQRYAAEARPLIEGNLKAIYLRRCSCRSDKTHCINGHSFAVHGRITTFKTWAHRQCRACELMRNKRGGTVKADVIEKVRARLAAKASLSSFTTGGKSGYLVKFSTLARYRRENPDFDRLVVDITKDSNRRAQQRRRYKIKTDAVREQNNDYFKVRAMVPATNPHRDDIVNRIFEDLLSGFLKREDVSSRIKVYITEMNRLYPTKYAKFGDSPLLSLDEMLFDDGTATRGDNVSRG
jgi:hypothetical protein